MLRCGLWGPCNIARAGEMQDEVQKLREHLKKAGLPTWMDVSAVSLWNNKVVLWCGRGFVCFKIVSFVAVQIDGGMSRDIYDSSAAPLRPPFFLLNAAVYIYRGTLGYRRTA